MLCDYTNRFCAQTDIAVPATTRQTQTDTSDTNQLTDNDCLICWDAITDTTAQPPSLSHSHLYCARQATREAGLTMVTPAAHNNCLRSLYKEWLKSPSDMRLPHCPKCTETLDPKITGIMLSTEQLVSKFYKLAKGRSTDVNLTHQSHIAEALLDQLRNDPEGLASLFTGQHKQLRRNIAVLHACIPLHEQGLINRIRQHVSQANYAQVEQILLALLSIHRRNPYMPLNNGFSQAILNGASQPDPDLAPRGQPRGNPATRLLWLANKTGGCDPTNPIMLALIGLYCPDASPTTYTDAILHLDISSRGHNTMLGNEGGQLQLIPRVNGAAYTRAIDLALAGFIERIDRDLSHSPVEDKSTLQTLRELRKHPHNAVKQTAQSLWSSYANEPATEEACLSILIDKHAQRKNLSVVDFKQVIKTVTHLVGNNFDSINALCPYAHAVLAYPPRKDNPLIRRVFQHAHQQDRLDLTQRLRDALTPRLKQTRIQLNNEITLSVPYQKALAYLEYKAQGPDESLVLEMLQKTRHVNDY